MLDEKRRSAYSTKRSIDADHGSPKSRFRRKKPAALPIVQTAKIACLTAAAGSSCANAGRALTISPMHGLGISPTEKRSLKS